MRSIVIPKPEYEMHPVTFFLNGRIIVQPFEDFHFVTVIKGNAKTVKRHSAKNGPLISKQSLNHLQDGSFPKTIRTMNNSHPINRVQVDRMIKHTEQLRYRNMG